MQRCLSPEVLLQQLSRASIGEQSLGTFIPVEWIEN